VNKIIFGLAAACAATALNAQQTAPVLDISLAPSGQKIAYLADSGNSTETVFVVDFAAGSGTPKPILVHPDPVSELRSCYWASEDRLICRLSFTADAEGNPQDFSRIFAMNGDGKEFVALSLSDMRNTGPRTSDGTVLALAPGGRPDKILMMRSWFPGVRTTTRVSQDDAGLGVDEVDLGTGERRRIEPPDPSAVAYAADETGKVRFKAGRSFRPGGPAAGEGNFSYRDAQSDRWRAMTVKDGPTDFLPTNVDSARNVVYGYATVNGRNAAVSLTLEDESRFAALAHRTDADVIELITIGTPERVVGAEYLGRSDGTAYFDEDLGKLMDGLRQALPGQPPIKLGGSSADGNRLLIFAGTADTVVAYLFERDTRQLSEVMPVRGLRRGLAAGGR
jgi:hypothetical protein